MQFRSIAVAAGIALACGAGFAGAANAEDEAAVNSACQALGAEYGRIITLGSGATANFCQFEDNRGCTLEAMEEGYCPEGGRKITGYATVAASYCAWLGGEVSMVDTIDASLDEIEGSCALPNGTTCLIGRLYYGSCE
ncbi:MAG: hypothetical protein R3F55_18165 [Alphaproteobacteria bacterium]